jgi:stage II sporulation protein D
VAAQLTADNGYANRHYRGVLRLVRVSGALDVINHVSLDDYVKGVVPNEMPAEWAPEALKAQAIAARSYALATRKPPGSLYDLYCDTRSQMYAGIESETGATDADVTTTAGEVAEYAGQVIPAFFFSTSGGRTAAIQDVWGGQPEPYLTSVADPYENSPYETWPEHLAYTPAQFASTLGLSGIATAVTVAVNASLRAESITVTHGGQTSTVTPGTLEWRFGLRSTWFRVLTLSITDAGGKVRAGARLLLHGSAPSNTWLWRRVGTSQWAPVRRLTTKTGPWATRVVASRHTIYRLRLAHRFGPAVVVG